MEMISEVEDTPRFVTILIKILVSSIGGFNNSCNSVNYVVVFGCRKSWNLWKEKCNVVTRSKRVADVVCNELVTSHLG